MQLDYILISNRWSTCVLDANVRWGPSEHRNIYGRADHALIDCEFKWKVRSPPAKLKKDFSVLFTQCTGKDELSESEQAYYDGCRQHQQGFEEAMEEKALELFKLRDGKQSIAQQYEDMCTTIHHAIDTLPDIPKTTHFIRA